MNYLHTMDQVIRRFQAAKLLPDSVTKELRQCHATVAEVYPRNEADLVASHNDLNLDVAVVANFFVKDETHEEAYLSAYFGERVDAYRRARGST